MRVFPLFLVFDEQRSADAESQRAAKRKAKEQEKKNQVDEPTVPAMESSGADLSSTQNKTNKKEKSSDDFYYEKFKKRARDNWRYQ